jgi:hypothetical protein
LGGGGRKRKRRKKRRRKRKRTTPPLLHTRRPGGCKEGSARRVHGGAGGWGGRVYRELAKEVEGGYRPQGRLHQLLQVAPDADVLEGVARLSHNAAHGRKQQRYTHTTAERCTHQSVPQHTTPRPRASSHTPRLCWGRPGVRRGTKTKWTSLALLATPPGASTGAAETAPARHAPCEKNPTINV